MPTLLLILRSEHIHKRPTCTSIGKKFLFIYAIFFSRDGNIEKILPSFNEPTRVLMNFHLLNQKLSKKVVKKVKKKI